MAAPAGFRFESPRPEDGAAIQRLVRESPPLDVNSTYAYLLLCRDFADTCVVARRDEGTLAGFVSAYLPPPRPQTLFVWQVAVAADCRGRGLAQAMIRHLLARPRAAGVRRIETTVSPSNRPSRRMFAALAQELGAGCEEETLFDAALFGDGAHEEETLLRIGAF
ncbi:diaminobutyrate acetyltransferase [Pigmentiphaga soli]|uniref:L-2,4-diaminobutyric acid acetyltransferase n=1 Tax=Pigmentiphaga soli TaxID=1007095 RepID=A0ABP8GF19_9BURK